MLLVSVYLGILVALSAAKPSWDYVANRAEQPPYAAWYQVPKSSSNYPSDAGYDRPSSNYERIPGYGRPSQGYAAYTRGMKNPPIEYGSELAVANNVLPGGSRKPIAPYYGNAVGGQPVMAAQDIDDRRSAILKYHPLLVRRPPKTPATTPRTPTTKVPLPSRRSLYNRVTMGPVVSKKVVSTGSGRLESVAPFTLKPSRATPPRPNTELFASIKDVVSKLRSSLDQAGVEQDVKKMGTQLENTWHELRRGLNRTYSSVRHSLEHSLQSVPPQRRIFSSEDPNFAPSDLGSHGRIDRLFERAQQMLQDPAAQRP
ncbi:hypothetical protein QR680_005418 [Steinernema hermaphroditum]|uniref:SXP/RAL-2 family protein Ani s 5-like cation-binding domain-containing protein n=1 Tax=Steinernema hermaphroditum TaxID=289476 RepID=A0AA39HT82_9BILA|nr:hypothetical protein QR680_005418 [Steinernema hermaphroditum]